MSSLSVRTARRYETAQQWEYKLASKANGHQYTQRATAKTEQEAYEAVANYYAKGFVIEREPVNVRPAHEVYGEINCM